jgi:uncharacterized coiled-coil protein SlyX
MITMSSAMQRPVLVRPPSLPGSPLKSVIIGIALCLATLLSGCSALRLTYNQGPALAFWWFDRYADFNGEQTPRVRESLAAWFRWNRSTQLPEYAQWFAQLQAEVTGPATPEAACRWFDGARQRLSRAYEQAVPAIAELAPTFTAEQFAHMEKRYARVNADFRDDYLQPDPRERHEAAVDRSVDQAEKLYGRLTRAQRELLSRGVTESPFDPELWLAERQARQQDVLATLRRVVAERPPADKVREALLGLSERTQRSPRPVYAAYQDRLIPYNCMLSAQLHNSTSAAQRLVAQKKLKGWEEDFRALAAEAAN